MRYLAGIVAILVLAGCSPGRGYIAVDRLLYEAIAPEYRAYVENDPNLDSDQKDNRYKTLDAWNAIITQAESTKAGD